METKFQTSFIPRKPLPGVQPSIASLTPHKVGMGGSIFMTLATIVFVVSVLSIGGVYLWKVYLLKAQADYKVQLTAKEKEFNIDQISFMKAQSSKIGLARQVLTNHIALSKIFSVIASLTSENVRFTAMDIAAPAGVNTVMQLALTGYGKNFNSVAFQSDVLNQLEKYGLRSVVRNPIVSNPTVNPNGTVNFSFTAQLDPSAFSYAKTVSAAIPQNPSGSTNTGTQ